MNHIGFKTWAEVLLHVSACNTTYYHAPFDIRPTRITCKVKKDTVRVNAPNRDSDPFTADVGHLERFKRANDKL